MVEQSNGQESEADDCVGQRINVGDDWVERRPELAMRHRDRGRDDNSHKAGTSANHVVQTMRPVAPHDPQRGRDKSCRAEADAARAPAPFEHVGIHAHQHDEQDQRR